MGSKSVALHVALDQTSMALTMRNRGALMDASEKLPRVALIFLCSLLVRTLFVSHVRNCPLLGGIDLVRHWANAAADHQHSKMELPNSCFCLGEMPYTLVT